MNDPKVDLPSDDLDHGLSGPEQAERRVGERHRSVWRIAKIVRTCDMGLWRVRNISDRGMMLSADVDVNIGEKLHISLSPTVDMRATVVWARKGQCGVAFEAPIDVAEVLRNLAAEQQSNGYRQPRLPFGREAEISVNGEVHSIHLINLSHSGVGFLHDGSLEIGKALQLMITPSVRRTAVVRWLRGGQGGLWLTEPLARTDLESIRRFEYDMI